MQTKSHNAVAAAVAQGRADWGVAIDTVAAQYGLGFIPLQEEHYDFVVPTARLERAPVQAFRALLDDPSVRGGYGRSASVSTDSGASPRCLALAQHLALHLAGRRHRQRVDELDLLRILVRREELAHVLLDVVLERRRRRVTRRRAR